MDGLVFLAQMLIEKFPVIGVVGAKGVVVVGLVTILLQIADVIVKLTPTQKDDLAVSKVKKVLDFLVPFLKLVPHVNPSPLFKNIGLILEKVLKGLKSATEEDKK